VTAIVEQPPPIARPDRRPTWDLVIEHVTRRSAALGSAARVDRVLRDMRERDAVGRERYGTALTSGNGRDHLMDAYAENLDLVVYLATELDERGVTLNDPIDDSRPDSWQLIRVQSMLWDQIRMIVLLRELIEERAS
jgi:hypothetical protein